MEWNPGNLILQRLWVQMSVKKLRNFILVAEDCDSIEII